MIKIFISSHKDAECLKDEPFYPIQVGAEKTKKELPGFLRDNKGQNLSEKNDKYCELTAQYWVWKNARKSEYVGFFHYRRYLSFAKRRFPETIYGTVEASYLDREIKEKFGLNKDQIEKLVEGYDVILPQQRKVTDLPNSGKTNRQLYLSSGFLHEKDLNIMLDVIREKYPDYASCAEEYLEDNETYLNNIFIMRWELFEQYSEWLFDILEECDNRIDYSDYSTEAIRTLGHLGERLLNIYIRHLRSNNDLKIRGLQMVYFLNTDPAIEPEKAFSERNIAIAMSANDYYSPFLATAIKSIELNSSKNRNYDILILNKDISAQNKKRITSMVTDKKNFSIRFIDISVKTKEFAKFYTRGHFTIETWFRLLLPDILKKYDKVLYLDSDLVVNADVGILYEENIDGYLLAACHDADTAGLYNGFDSEKKSYMDNILKITKPYDYFQAGVILFNLKEFRKINTEKLLRYASSYQWQLLDQDVLNNIAQGRVKFVDMSWNVMYDWLYRRRSEIIAFAPKRLQDEYDEAHKDPKIIHYAGPDKPWNDPEVDYADVFWRYCRETPYYEAALKRMMISNNNFKKTGLNSVKKIIKEGVFPATSKRGIAVRRLKQSIKRRIKK